MWLHSAGLRNSRDERTDDEKSWSSTAKWMKDAHAFKRPFPTVAKDALFSCAKNKELAKQNTTKQTTSAVLFARDNSLASGQSTPARRSFKCTHDDKYSTWTEKLKRTQSHYVHSIVPT